MKRILGLILVLLMTVSIVGINGLTFAEPNTDEAGIDAWISKYHDAQGTGYSSSNLVFPLKEADGWPIEVGSGQRAFSGCGTAIHNGVLYTQFMNDFGGSASDVIAYSVEDGEELWRVQVEGGSAWGMTPAIDVEKGILYVGSARPGLFQKEGVDARGVSYVTALSMESGDEMWSAGIQGTISGSPIYAEGAVYAKSIFFKDTEDKEYSIADNGSMITKLDVESDGEIIWEKELDGAWYFEWDSPPIFSDGMVYATTSHCMLSSKGSIKFGSPVTLYAIDAESGEINWQNSGDSEDTRLCGGVCADQEFVYFSYTAVEGNSATLVLSAYAKDTGDKQWDYSSSGVGYWSTPIINNDYVFLGSQDGSLIVVNKEDGKKFWSKKVGDMTRGTTYAVTEKFVVAASDKMSGNAPAGSRVQMFDIEAKGKKVWDETFDDGIDHVSIYADYVFLCSRYSIFSFKSESPELAITPDKVELGKVERSSKREVKLAIKNKGIPGLEGKIETEAPWMKLSTDKLDDDTKEVIVTVDTTGLEIKDYVGKIIFTSNGGNKTLSVTMKIIDTTAPIITWDYTGLLKVGEDYYTKEKQYKLKGTTEPTAIVKIQGKDVEIDAEGKFEIVVDLTEGKNEISVETTDDVPNNSKTTFILFLDTKAPQLTLTTENYTLVTEASSYIMGQVDDKEAVVSINEEVVPLTPAGSFAKMVVIEKGENKFTVKAVDKVGNETIKELILVNPPKKLIVLVVGKKEAEVNGDIVKMDIAPVILKGSTMVPLRSLGDFLGAKVDYAAKEQKITFTLYGKVIELIIGRTTGKVNGEPVVMQVPPTIISGRTVVPLRFVSENLGAKVDYEAKSRTITITYPNPAS